MCTRARPNVGATDVDLFIYGADPAGRQALVRHLVLALAVHFGGCCTYEVAACYLNVRTPRRVFHVIMT